jgi:hypothetical protein
MQSLPLHRLAAAVPAAAVCLAGAFPVWADAIDGHWCFPDGKRISIQGPDIVTPGGSHIQGDYARHFFAYLMPQAEVGGGQTVSMTLINEDTVHLRIGTAPSYSSDGPAEVWHRCGPPTS